MALGVGFSRAKQRTKLVRELEDYGLADAFRQLLGSAVARSLGI